MSAPTVVSTFAGCGGSSLGYKQAGYACRLAVEWDKRAAESYRRNFPATPIFEGDIATLSADQALDLAGLEPGELDVFDGSPPCQGFSMTGKRRSDDPRSQLYLEYLRLLEAFRPKALVMENVAGLVKGKMLATIFPRIMSGLRDAGYRVACRLLDAKFFGVPQSRQRVIFVGVRHDVGIEPSHPRAEQPPIPVRVALRDAQPLTLGPGLSDLERLIWATTNPGETGGDTTWARGRFWDARKLDPRKPSWTVKASTRGALMHWAECRRLSIEECKVLMGFPVDYELAGDFAAQWKQLGNGVPPGLMRAVAAHVRETVLEPMAVSA
ncbi:MAG TPA: DNA cytosine methyltransferase [Candidatus Limnocylindria bacterium]|nr:DNA cytosine methyltransferase [Candidatus Limnocylindria bacterium]